MHATIPARIAGMGARIARKASDVEIVKRRD